MNREIKRVSTIVVAMFLALLVSTTILQVFQADSLSTDARNTRARNDSYAAQRGAMPDRYDGVCAFPEVGAPPRPRGTRTWAGFSATIRPRTSDTSPT